MSVLASIDVQFKPFKLSLMRDDAGQWIAALYRIGDEVAGPLVLAVSDPAMPGQGAHVTLVTGAPRLAVAGATFSVPTKQLQRLRDWIDQQTAPVVVPGDAALVLPTGTAAG